MPKKVCSSKVPIDRREDAGVCYKKGMRVGFVAGLKKSTQPVQSINISDYSQRQLGALAQTLKIKGYSNMKKKELIEALVQTGKYHV